MSGFPELDKVQKFMLLLGWEHAGFHCIADWKLLTTLIPYNRSNGILKEAQCRETR
jgi:hypothetical protein